MAYFRISDDVRVESWEVPKPMDPKVFYKGKDYPDYYTEGEQMNLSDSFDIPQFDGKHPDFVNYYVTMDGYIHTPLSLKDYRTRRVSKMRIGKFVERFFPDCLTKEELTNFVASLTTPQIKFSTEFRDVYERSEQHCNSCMTEKFGDWRWSPMEVYDGGDLQIAYTENFRGEVTGRAICWPEKMIYQRIYSSNTHVFEQQMKALGYKQGNINGAKLKFMTKDKQGNNQDYILMPYMDCGGSTMYSDGQLRAGAFDRSFGADEVQYFSAGQEGYREYRRVSCAVSGEYGHKHEMLKAKHPYYGNDHWYSKKTAEAGRGVDPWGYLDLRKSHSSYYRENVYPRYMYDRSVICSHYGIRVPEDQAVYVYANINDYLSYAAIERYYRRDILTGDLHPINEMMELTNGTFIRYQPDLGEDQAVQAVA